VGNLNFVWSFVLIGYLLTWTSYGSWLQGNRRGWVQDGQVYSDSVCIEGVNAEKLKSKPVVLTELQQSIVYDSIIDHAVERSQQIFALAVAGNHVHLLIEECDEKAGRLAARYKNVAVRELADDFKGRKIWTKGFDKRFCNDPDDLHKMVEYVRGHENLTRFVYIGQVLEK
jgi:REP element-mobilizing transposase RayT